MSLKFGSPLLGYNNNFRHKGRVFHIQTEDSGAKYGHIITHLFMDGGRILKSVKTSYAEHLESDRRSEIVRELMKEQHKAMAIALRDGKFDPIVEGNTSASQGTLDLVAAGGAVPPVKIPAPMPAPATHGALSPLRMPIARAAAAPPSSSSRKAAAAIPESAARIPVPKRSAKPDFEPDAAAVDLDRLERAAAAASAPTSIRQPPSDLPPPPVNLLREKTAKGTYRVTSNSSVPAAAPRGASSRPAGAGASASPPVATGRPNAARPASSFGQARPQGQSIFGEVTDKSLDEVILSYLAAELEPDKK